MCPHFQSFPLKRVLSMALEPEILNAEFSAPSTSLPRSQLKRILIRQSFLNTVNEFNYVTRLLK